ncbi:hypothetical protein GJ688_16340 [Heliobacillus mobilis]|uniref:Transposase n=1 Tax=Heliobacterium mobile TaxID=28064 RepID=A0A6I3SPA6_HELMO|nr:hypothetical protein [Heliobacterium mobile]
MGHTILRIIFHILLTKKPYIELGADYLERFCQEKEKRREAHMIRLLEVKGFKVTPASAK